MSQADRPVRVLVVEDDEALAELTAEVLRDDGAEVEVARSLEDVEAMAPRVRAQDLALLDVNLGEGKPSGLDVYAWLLDHDFAGRVVFITGHATTNPLVTAASVAPRTRLVSKPYDVRLLLELVAHEGAPR